RGLRSPLIYEAIRDAEPLTPIYGYRHTANVRRHYERLDLWPEGLLVLGDALCAFNPVYGQGMTVCALEAAALGEALTRYRKHRFCRSFQRDVAKIVDTSWLLATGEDLRWPQTTGARRTLVTRLLHRYLDRVIGLIPQDPQIFSRFARVTHMMASPGSLFHPGVLWKTITPRRRRPSPPEQQPTLPNSSLPAEPRSARAS